MVLNVPEKIPYKVITGGFLNGHADAHKSALYFLHNSDRGIKDYHIYRTIIGSDDALEDVTPRRVVNIDAEIERVLFFSVSPTGKRMAVACKVNGSWGLCVGDIEHPLKYMWLFEVDFPSVEEPGFIVTSVPHWSPDGEWIAYSSDEDGDWDIYVVRPDGTDKHNITADWPSNESMPAWRY